MPFCNVLLSTRTLKIVCALMFVVSAFSSSAETYARGASASSNQNGVAEPLSRGPAYDLFSDAASQTASTRQGSLRGPSTPNARRRIRRFSRSAQPPTPGCYVSYGDEICNVTLGQTYYLPATIVNNDGGHVPPADCGNILFDPTGNPMATGGAFSLVSMPSPIPIDGPCATVTYNFNWAITGLSLGSNISGVTYYTIHVCYPTTGAPCDDQRWHWNNGFIVSVNAPVSDVTTNSRPHAPVLDKDRCEPCRAQRGDPVDVTSGQFVEEKTDLSLPGPYGLRFTRYYANQSPDSGDMGAGWSHNFSDGVSFPSGGQGQAIYVDSHENPHYFGPTGGYDSIGGLKLSIDPNGATSTLTEFDGSTKHFNSAGFLTSTSDRIGNTQTITRDPVTQLIQSVSDPLGRQLCFYYDSSSRISVVGAWFSPSTCPTASSSTSPSVALQYDSGTDPSGNSNCSTGDLCSVKEPDGAPWTYGYDLANDPINLTAIYDPLGNPQVVNTYSGYQVATQHRGSGTSVGGNINFQYVSPAPTGATSSPGETFASNQDTGEASTFYFDSAANLTQVSGKLCECNGYQSASYTFDPFGRMLTQSDAGNQSTGQAHIITYTYGRDTSTQAYPGPTSVTETLDAAGNSRAQLIAYYPVGDPRQDLARTIQVRSVDTLGLYRTTTLTYSVQGLLTETDDTGYVNGYPTTRVYKKTYDTRGRMLTSTQPRSDVNATTTTTYFSDSDTDLKRAGQISSVTDALGHQITLASVPGFTTYTPYAQPQSLTDVNGVATTFDYDKWGRLTSSTLNGVTGDSVNLTDTSVYDVAGRLVARSRPLGNGVAVGYDTADRDTTETLVDPSGQQRDRLAISYNSADEMVTRSAQTCTQPSSSCLRWTTTTAYGYQYDTFGELVKILDPDTASSTGDLKTIFYTNQGVPAAAFDENHQFESGFSGTSVAGVSVNNYGWTYDYAGRALTAQRFLPAASVNPPTTYTTTGFTYDIADNITSDTDPNGNLTYYHHDDFGNVLSENSPVSGQTTYGYDANDNLISSRDASGAVTTYTYDALDRPTQSVSTKPSMQNEAVSWKYDDPTPGNFSIGRLSSMSDPAGTTTYAYERRGLITTERRVIDGYAFTESYAYDGNGNRQVMTYPDGLSLAYSYDWADRPYSVGEIAAPSLSADARERSRSPVPVIRNRFLEPAARTRSVRLAPRLDGQGLPAPGTITWLPHPPPPHRGVTRSSLLTVPAAVHPIEEIDPQMRRALAILAHVGKASSTIPALPRPRSRRQFVSVMTALVTGTTYAPFGPMTARAFGNGTLETMALDQRYGVAQNELTNSANAVLTNLQYDDDPAGNIIGISDVGDPRFSKAFAYDDMNRLVASITGPVANVQGAVNNHGVPTPSPAPTSGIGLWGSAVYAYDRMGNTTADQVGTRVSKFNYSGTTSKLTSVVSSSTTAGSVTYDAAGNETGVGLDNYQYSARGNLVSASGPEYSNIAIPGVGAGPITVPSSSLGKPWAYKYDGFGQRLATTINEVAQATGAVPITQGLTFKQPTRYSIPGPNGMLATETSVNNVGVPAYDYVWMGDSPVAQLDGTGTHYTFVDHLEAPTIQTDATGAITYQADYEPYGKIYDLRGTANPHQPLRLPGQVAEQFDSGANGVTDLSYNNARWYRPEWGRYTQADPRGVTTSQNLFGYVEEAPTGFVDPSGLCKIIIHHTNPLGKGKPDFGLYHTEVETLSDNSDTLWIGNRGDPNGLFSGTLSAYAVPGWVNIAGRNPTDPNTTDHTSYWVDGKGAVVLDTGCQDDCSRLNKKIQDLFDNINSDEAPYDIFGLNSNTVAAEVLSLAGLSPDQVLSLMSNEPGLIFRKPQPHLPGGKL